MHARVMHNGIGETLTEIQQRFWIPLVMQTVDKMPHTQMHDVQESGRKTTSSCEDTTFARIRIMHFRQQEWTTCMLAQSTSEEQINNRLKCTFAFFTCANIRAVHLELVEDLLAEAFIRALIFKDL